MLVDVRHTLIAKQSRRAAITISTAKCNRGALIFLEGLFGAVELNKVEGISINGWQTPGIMKQG